MKNICIHSEISVNLPGFRVLGTWDTTPESTGAISGKQRGSPAPALCIDATERRAYILVSEESTDSVYLATVEAEGRHLQTLCMLPVSGTDAQVACIQFLMEKESVFVALRSGDIFSISAGNGTWDIETVGTVDSGIAGCAWSPDDEVLAVVTGEGRLLLMTQEFDVLNEFALTQDEQGEVQHVAVGWGTKATQYHGKAGKAAALEDTKIDTAGLSADDDFQVRVSWRGDGDFFAVTLLDPAAGREIRVFSREGKLHSVGEKIAALEHTLAWKPSGRLVAATEKQSHRHDVVFYERNGLRHGDFTLRASTRRVLDLAWNADSSVLAVLALVDTRGDGTDLEPCVELWSDKNYHWYLKQELRSSSFGGDLISHVVWDPEDSFCLHVLGQTAYMQVRLHMVPDVSHVAADDSNSAACVVDGDKLLYTPFAVANVPPPMALHTLSTGIPATHLAFSAFGSGNDFAVLLSDRRTVILHESASASNVSQMSAPVERLRVMISSGSNVRQICWPKRDTIVALGGDSISVLDVDTGTTESYPIADLMLDTCDLTTLVTAPHAALVIVQDSRGQVYSLDVDSVPIGLQPIVQLPAPCVEIDAVAVDGMPVVVGRTDRNQLFANNHLISSVCSSFYLRRDMLIFTTTTHFARFVPVDGDILTATPSEDSNSAVSKYDESRRRVERGSTIVLASPVGENVIFQMPRGNLETVRPRALVLAVVRRTLDDHRYREAMLNCRVNRIDMNIIYDHNPKELISRMDDFVLQVNDPDLLNLFVSGLRDEDVTRTMYTGLKPRDSESWVLPPTTTDTDGKVSRVCRALRSVLQAANDPRFMQTILTTFVCQTPPDIAAALQLLAPLSAEERDSALTYLLFLSDVNTVYDSALGLYDLTLALLVAQRSQRDPREYLAALGALNALPNEEYRRFKIDSQLGRMEKALGHLCTAYEQLGSTDDMWDEMVAYVKDTVQYQIAIKLLIKDQRRFCEMCELYGDHQAEANTGAGWSQAAASYTLAGSYSKAISAHVQAKEWRSAMSAACSAESGCSPQMIHDTATRASAVLADHHMFMDAAMVLLEYTEEDEDAVALLVRGSHWTEAIRSSLLRQRADLIETTVQPGIMRAYEALSEDIDEIRDALTSKCSRLREVRSKPLEMIIEHHAALAGGLGEGTDGPLPDNIDVMSDTTSLASKFSTFTGTVTNASSRMTGSTARRISKNKRKEERRKVRGKKGSIYEESYLVDSISKLVDRVRVNQGAVREINLVLVRFGKLQMAAALQSSFETVVQQILSQAEFVFDQQRVQMRLGESGVPEPVPLETNDFGMPSQPKHPKPVLPTFEWKIDAVTI
ncbi:putative elongator complex protein 1 [Coemansia erecta]|uniref:Elongator complex protein 1 n=1 Tax=Coemansia erecta TaxID=147472 RepID=A0A9W7Y054_9FUNG|nr:putative elongator complex protein 1 [Coemansia erecta]